ncbi:MAG: hypothetical protein H0Z30_03410 [Candidatus Marinimicrobia bacterium]|nr:hypothetical protein [Candidatus Neomarinimicrobiota bacterium]
MDINSKIIKNSPEISATVRDIKLRKAAKEIEAIFIAQVIKAMEKSLPSESIGGKKNNLVNMLFSSTMGKAIAEKGGIGLADIIYKSLKSRDEFNEEAININSLPGEEYLKSIELMKGIVVPGDIDERE